MFVGIIAGFFCHHGQVAEGVLFLIGLLELSGPYRLCILAFAETHSLWSSI